MLKIKDYEQKKCFYCGSPITKKNGKKYGRQQYKCYACGKQFTGGERLSVEELWQEYHLHKQTVKELAARYKVSQSTIKRRLRAVEENFECKDFPFGGTVLLDATYFGRDWGVVLAMDCASRKKLWRKYVRHEKLLDYQESIDYIRSKNYRIEGIVCDGLNGIFKQFSSYKVQMCQKHQIEIVRRYLTRNPKLQAGKELLYVINKLTKLSEKEFIITFEAWHVKWSDFLMERAKGEQTGKTHFVHKKLRSAYLSIKRHLPYLFTSESVRGMPNTNNIIEGTFTALKNKLRNHNGMSKENRKRFIDRFFKA